MDCATQRGRDDKDEDTFTGLTMSYYFPRDLCAFSDLTSDWHWPVSDGSVNTIEIQDNQNNGRKVASEWMVENDGRVAFMGRRGRMRWKVAKKGAIVVITEYHRGDEQGRPVMMMMMTSTKHFHLNDFNIRLFSSILPIHTRPEGDDCWPWLVTREISGGEWNARFLLPWFWFFCLIELDLFSSWN